MLPPFSLILVLVTSLTAAGPPSLDEYQVKAAFLYNFAKFIDWPAEHPHDPFRICVLGQDPFGRALDNVVAGRSIGERPVAVVRISVPEAAAGCQVLFVASSERKRILPMLAEAAGTGVLSVGEVGTPTSSGMIVNFALEGGSVRFEVDVAAAAREKLSLSSKLLNLAIRVKK